jgi:RNA polymerase sigma-70 factor, ECF subfamily
MSELEQIYDEYVDKLYKYFYIQCMNRHVAEDLTSQTFVLFVEKVRAQEINDTKKYLYAIMRNVWAAHLRQKYKETVESIETIEDFEAHTDTMVHNYESVPMKERAARYIEQLPDKQREVARLRFLEERTPKEVAQELRKSILYVKTTQHRALKSLERMLAKSEIRSIIT